MGIYECGCPIRLATGTLQGIVQHLVEMFYISGRGRQWDYFSFKGNPALSPCVKQYVKTFKEEQARSHILPKQAKPIFISKIRRVCSYIDRELLRPDISLKDKFLLFRDQAIFKLQIFSGDRASDLGNVLTQEISKLVDGTGLVFKRMFGKTLKL